MKKTTVTACAILLVLAAVLLGAWLRFRPAAAETEKTVTLTVCHSDGTEKSVSVRTKGACLRSALDAAGFAGGREGPYGLYLLTVDGETADETKNEWWGYTVNGADAAYGVDTQPIADGDDVVFTLHEGW